MAGVATGLLAIDLTGDWSPDLPSFVLLNRGLMVVLVGVAALLVRHFARLERRSQEDMGQLADINGALDHAAIVATTDVSGRITYVNDKFCEISWYARDELLGQDHRVVNSGLHPKTFMRALWRTIASGHVWHGEIRNRRKDGTCYWVDTTIVPFLTSQGKPYQYVAIRADITARRTAEAKLREQAALARVGQMAAIVTHEVKNPLAGIKGVVQILKSRRAPGDQETAVLGEIISRIDALNELIQDLMLFARPRPQRLAPVALHPLLREAAAMLTKDPIGAGVDVTLDGEDATVSADDELLRATILNLLLNAAQAMDGRGRIAITLDRRGDQWAIAIQDTGPGIPPELQQQVFEPFFTTKARGGGLGLAVARRTAEVHGGTLGMVCPEGGAPR